jgi:hypothetical protein
VSKGGASPRRAVAATLLCLLWLGGAAALARADGAASDQNTFAATAEQIRSTYDSAVFTLSPYRMGHYGLRMFRQTQDPRYDSLIWVDMAHWASRLNRISAELYTDEQIDAYTERRLAAYRLRAGERNDRRLLAAQERPDYLLLGARVLPALARIDAYGLAHRDDERLRALLRRHDFHSTVTDPAMIRAWAAQLANQVYWLRQLGEAELVDEYITAFRATYPEAGDEALSDQQFRNKLYGLTHLVIAASGYYRWPVVERDHQWVFDYFRKHLDAIERRGTQDILAEIGVCFLLADLDDAPALQRIRARIAASVLTEHGVMPSSKGSVDLQTVEHRNSIAILLLDWRGAHAVPTATTHPELFKSLPFGLAAKQSGQLPAVPEVD